VLLTAGPGYGKTTVLEQALGDQETAVAWIGCSGTERSAGRLLTGILDAISAVAPGVSDALSERLAVAPEQVDPLAAIRVLLADVSRLLVEPLSLVFDDAEHLDGADESLRLLSELVRSEVASLHVAIASRGSLNLRIGKPRATGRLTEFTAGDLAFDAEECASLLRMRGGRDPLPEEISEVMEATEGWPLGIALAAGRAAGGPAVLRDLRSAPEVRSFVSEELLDGLDPDLREATISSSVTRVVTPQVALTLDLPEDFEERMERTGMPTRTADDGEGFTYHPLLREVLLELLRAERSEEELRRLHGLVAPAVAESGDPVASIEHRLEARDWPEAIAAIEQEGPALARSSPTLVRGWLSLLPADARARPTIRSLEGQLDAGAGDHPRAAAILREAVAGFHDHPNPAAEWFARFVLADSLMAIGGFDEASELANGWDDPSAVAAGILAPATAVYISIGLAMIGRFEESDALAAQAFRHPDAAVLRPAEALRRAFRDTPQGHLDETLTGMQVAVEELEGSDPFNRRLYFLVVLAQMYAECGRTAEALETWMRVREDAGGGGGPFLADTTYAWRAELLAQDGQLAEAEAELAHYRGQETSWRTMIGDLARTSVASLRGDAAETVAGAETTLNKAADGPVIFIHRGVADLIPSLVRVGRADLAREILDSTFALLDQTYPGDLGRFPRARLIALRAWLHHVAGETDHADADLQILWDQAGETLPNTLRREWVRLEPVVWDALEHGAIGPGPAFGALLGAFPNGLQLVPFLEHPVPDVRRAVLEPATKSGDPRALGHLAKLAKDPDPDLAGAASHAIGRLARILPPLRFELLGRFAVRRGSWQAGDAWNRPVDARLVRFLLVNLDQPVPEDAIFEALWPDLEVDGARKSLQVAISRARRVLDPPGSEQSVIESIERTYRLVLGRRDGVDAEEFLAAAGAALGETGEKRKTLLEHARSLWGGEPLPEERYSDWTTGYRERLVDRHTGVLAALVAAHEEAGEHGEAADVARELVDLDVLNEGGHRALIRAYARTGRTGRALRQYLECRRALVEQLGVEPAEATSRLQARILAGEPI
jgi:ATP/maltotriose-dependent transcriptional regulator MalT/DNA-binding SARP family transcriptional activator